MTSEYGPFIKRGTEAVAARDVTWLGRRKDLGKNFGFMSHSSDIKHIMLFIGLQYWLSLTH